MGLLEIIKNSWFLLHFQHSEICQTICEVSEKIVENGRHLEASWGAKLPKSADLGVPFGTQNGPKTAQGGPGNHQKTAGFYSISELGRVQGAALEASKNASKNGGGRPVVGRASSGQFWAVLGSSGQF